MRRRCGSFGVLGGLQPHTGSAPGKYQRSLEKEQNVKVSYEIANTKAQTGKMRC
jgi:hypothetical protein